MARTSDANKVKKRPLVACVIIIGILVMSIAHADLPAGVKKEYKYDQSDSSIIFVKNRLRDLGYFGDKNARFSDFVSQELKKAVMSFQKKNKVKVDGILDEDLLNLLFSSDAIGKDGKKKQMRKATKKPSAGKKSTPAYVTKAPDSATMAPKRTITYKAPKATEKPKEETNLSDLMTQEGIRADKQRQSIILALTATAGICILAAVFRAVWSAGRKKRQSLAETMEQYKKFRQDERLVQKINEAGITMSILVAGGEYFLVPLRQRGNRFRLRYNQRIVRKVEKKYGTKIVSMLHRITQSGLRQDKINRRICDIWGARKEGSVSIATDVGKDAYERTRHLFTSLGSSRIIRGNAWVTWDAFLLLVWECALNENIRLAGIAQKNIREAGKASGRRNSYQDDVTALYKVMNFSVKDTICMMTAKEYIENGRTPWHTVFARNRDAVRDIVREIR